MAPLSGQWRHRSPSGGRGDGGASGPDDPAAAAGPDLLGRHGDGHVGDAVDDRGDELGAGGGGVAQVGVDEQQQTGGSVHVVAHPHHAGAGLQGGRLAAGDGVTDSDRAGGAGVILGAVGGSVIDDDDEIDARH